MSTNLPDLPPASTKERILDAAEELFADHGFAGTSLRALTGAAEVNLAAVHYHFGSKGALFEAVIRRRVDALNAERLRRLDELQADGDPPTLEQVLETFLAPALLQVPHGDRGFQTFHRLIGRIVGSPGPEEHDLLITIFQQVLTRFFPALQAAAPHLGPAELHWRFHFLIGSMCTALFDPARVHAISCGICPANDPEETLRQLLAYATAGFAAPVPKAR